MPKPSVRIPQQLIRDAAVQPAVTKALGIVAGNIARGAEQEYKAAGRDVNVTVQQGVRPGARGRGFRRPYANVVVTAGQDRPDRAEYGDDSGPGARALLRAAERYG